MAKTAAQLKVAVAGFLQRDPSVFVRTVGATTFDVLLQALNNARLYAERLVDFEKAKVAIEITGVSVTSPGNLANAKLFGTATSVAVKKIISPFLPAANNQQYPVELYSRKAWVDSLARRYALSVPRDVGETADVTNAPFRIIQQGDTLAVAPPDEDAFSSSTFTIYADAVRWLPDYILGTETDFLLDYCFDWLMYRSIMELNYYLKEDERVNLSQTLVAQAWNAVVQWNNELVNLSADDMATLD